MSQLEIDLFWPIKKSKLAPFQRTVGMFRNLRGKQLSCYMLVDLETKLSSPNFSQKMDKQNCFSILIIWKYLKPEFGFWVSSTYLRVMRIEKQIRSFVLRSTDLYCTTLLSWSYQNLKGVPPPFPHFRRLCSLWWDFSLKNAGGHFATLKNWLVIMNSDHC